MNPSPSTQQAGAALAALAADQPLIDLRAPEEFVLGAPPNAYNLPLVTDAERKRIGITYKQQGQEAAIRLGHKLVTGDTREQRILGWQSFVERHPETQIYCWRGGQRSEIALDWLREAGSKINRIDGGYKALRQASLNALTSFAENKQWWVLGGRTGSGKTRVLNQINWSLDLEGYAQHRGSAFGGKPQPQPTPISFEFLLTRAALQHQGPGVLAEDESRTIGRLALPEAWFAKMKQAPVIILHASLEERCANIVGEYVTEPLAAKHSPDQLMAAYQGALERIRKRLGGKRWQEIDDLMQRSFITGDHTTWVEALLVSYYDPMYDHQLAKKAARVRFEGDAEEAIEYLVTAPVKHP